MTSELSSPFAARVSLATDPMPREWQNFFNNLFTRVGGNSAFTNLELAELIEDLSYKSYCFVHKDGTNQSISAGVGTTVTWAVADYDTQSEVDLVNEKWVANKAGVYLVTCQCVFGVAADQDRVWLSMYQNADVVAEDRGGTGSAAQATRSIIVPVYCAKDDYILFKAVNNDNNDSVVGGKTLTHFSIYRLGD